MSNLERNVYPRTFEGSGVEPPTSMLKEALGFCTDSISNPLGRMRQAQVFADGCVVGAIKDAEVEFNKHPVETAGKVVASFGTGFVLAAVKSRFLLGAAAVAGMGFLAQSLAHSYDKLSSDKSLSQAMADVWRSGDNLTMSAAMQSAERSMGAEAFNYGLGIVCGGAGVWAERRGLSMMFSARHWMDEALGYSSIKWTRMSDGTKVADMSGIKAIQLKDGTKIWEFQNGTRETWHPDGRSVAEHPNGARHISNADGSQEIYYPNGAKVSLPSIGTRVTELGNGAVIRDFHDGGRFVTKADGTFIRTDLNGSKYVKYPNGDSVDVGPHVRPKGARLVYKNADMTLTAEMPDGKKFSWVGNDKVYEHNGSKFTFKPDGDWYIEPAKKAE